MNSDFNVVGVFQEYFNRYLAYLDSLPADTEILKISFQFLQENQVGEVAGWVKRQATFEIAKGQSLAAS